MWLVNAALRHPYTVWVGMLLVTALGFLSYRRTPTDILPNLKVPVVVVFSSYRGMPAPDMEQTVTAILERALTKCDHLDHIESRSLLGISIIQVYFRPTTTGEAASSQVISLVNGEMQNMPPGMLPPNIVNYDASAIPVGNLVVSSRSRDDKFLLDLADTRLREELAGIEGLSSAPVFGGLFRQVQIYVHPRTLETLNLSPLDVARIVNRQSTVIPTGEIRIDKQNYYVRSNSMLADPKDFEEVPLFNDGRKIVRLKDVAEIVDGTRWRTNVVRVDGRKAVYMPLLRQAGASAVRVVDNVQHFLSELHDRGAVPDDVDVEVAFDQSVYVRDALANLRNEAIIGAVLASLVVLLFLGSIRTTWIVAVSIPLSLLAAFVGLYFAGETLNIMTLGGLALVLGRLVDDSVVDVENTVRHLHMGKTPFQAARDSAIEIATPVLMATVTTVIVFLPMVFMTGMGKYLFTPLAISVALALFSSYIVSRTVSPLLCSRFLRTPMNPYAGAGAAGDEFFPRWLVVVSVVFAALGAFAWAATSMSAAGSGQAAGVGAPSGRSRRRGHDDPGTAWRGAAACRGPLLDRAGVRPRVCPVHHLLRASSGRRPAKPPAGAGAGGRPGGPGRRRLPLYRPGTLPRRGFQRVHRPRARVRRPARRGDGTADRADREPGCRLPGLGGATGTRDRPAPFFSWRTTTLPPSARPIPTRLRSSNVWRKPSGTRTGRRNSSRKPGDGCFRSPASFRRKSWS